MNSFSIFQAADVTDKPVAIVAIAREAVEQAIAALKSDEEMATAFHIEISALRAALEQPVEQEPVSWLHPDWPAKKYKGAQSPVTTYTVNDWIPLYAHPQPKRDASGKPDEWFDRLKAAHNK